MIALIGFGILGNQIYQLAGLGKRGAEIVAFDDNAVAGERGIDVRPFNALDSFLGQVTEAYLGLGYKRLSVREDVLDKIEAHNIPAPSLLHESGIVAASVKIGAAAYIYPGVLLDEHVEVGRGALLNNRVTVSHDSFIGHCSFLAPGVVICGGVRIGSRTFVGAGSIIVNGVVIGDDVTIGAGSLVAQDVASGSTVVGNPMRYVTGKLKIS